MQQIADWLEKLGMSEYAQRFAENRIDFSVLPDLTDQDLEKLGVVLGDRRKILRAIAALDCATQAAPVASMPPVTAPSPQYHPAVIPATAEAAGERRYLTVMFCDLVGSTGISAQLDAEEWRDIVTSYHRTVAQVVIRFSGHVAKNLGDGVLVYFGYPQAQENDAERALHAGLAIVEAISARGLTAVARATPPLSVRVGIHAGPVVLSKDAELYGDVPNIAARVQTAAEAGMVLITSEVHRLVSGLFVVSDRGLQSLKGVPEPISLFHVVRASGTRKRRATAHLQLVGRDEELQQLENRWQRARAGQGQLIWLVGEAGIGKSRLAAELHSRIAEQPHTWTEMACSQLLQNTPFHPFVESAKRLLEKQEPAPDGRVAALAAWHRAVGLEPAQSVPLIAPLLELSVPTDYPPPLAAPEERRRRLIATLTGWVVGGARTQAIVLQVEDVHWADPSTLDLLHVLAEQSVGVPLMLLITGRPEFRPPWPHRSHHTVITLAPLDRQEVEQMAQEVAARHPLTPHMMEVVVTRTGGVPLFVEEVTRLLLESSSQAATQVIPSTLQALLTARLDRLGSAKETAQFASVLGREFSYEVIHAVAGQSDAGLIQNLERLADADLVHVDGIPPESSYRFKHALLLDAAYESLLKSRRRDIHRVIAETLSENFTQIANAQPELLAYHLTQAGLAEQAIRLWLQAGHRAVERSANMEAISQFSNGLELVQFLPEGAKRDQLELDLRTAVGVPLIASRGYAAPEVESTYARARELSERLGGSPQFANIVWGLWVRYLSRGSIGAALEMAEQYRAIAERTQDSGPSLGNLPGNGNSAFLFGGFCGCASPPRTRQRHVRARSASCPNPRARRR
jgi:class 3 adenylate cyclase